MTPHERTRIEKAATDCGFDLTPVVAGEAIEFGSSQFPERVTIQWAGTNRFSLRPSSPALFVGQPGAGQGALPVEGFEALYAALGRIAAAARTLPDRVAEKFAEQTRNLPKSTEAERLVVQRVGQNLFREALLDFWQGRCCVTGLAIPELLRASHIKPWAHCASDAERLDVFNGLLLAPHLDALFDGGWISFATSGEILISPLLNADANAKLGLNGTLGIEAVDPRHERYLAYHRGTVFRYRAL